MTSLYLTIEGIRILSEICTFEAILDVLLIPFVGLLSLVNSHPSLLLSEAYVGQRVLRPIEFELMLGGDKRSVMTQFILK